MRGKDKGIGHWVDGVGEATPDGVGEKKKGIKHLLGIRKTVFEK